MPIHTAGAPSPELHALVARHLSNPLAAPQLPPVKRGDVSASEPYPVYVLTLEELEAAEETMAEKTPRVWRHLLVHQGSAVGEVDVTAEEAAPRVVAVHRGPRAPGTARALETAQQSSLLGASDFELRMVEAPAIYLVALWLHAPYDDVLIALDPDKSGLPLYEPTPLEQALPVLRRRAAQVRAAQAAAPGPSGA